MTKQERELLFGQYLTDIRTLVQQAKALCDAKGAKLLIIVRPDKNELLRSDDPTPKFGIMGLPTFNLFEYYLTKTDMSNPENIPHYFWKIDAHHNTQGYALYAKGVYEYIKVEPTLINAIRGGY